MSSLCFHCSLRGKEGTKSFLGPGPKPRLVLVSPPRKQVAAEMALGTVTPNRDGQRTTSGMLFSAYHNVLKTKRTFSAVCVFFLIFKYFPPWMASCPKQKTKQSEDSKDLEDLFLIRFQVLMYTYYRHPIYSFQ